MPHKSAISECVDSFLKYHISTYKKHIECYDVTSPHTEIETSSKDHCVITRSFVIVGEITMRILK